MLLIPFDRTVDWRRPPIVTLLLILINVGVFTVIQSGDDARLQDAIDFYQESGLAGIEGPRYAEYLGQKGEERPDLSGDASFPAWVIDLEVDFEFQQLIQSRRLVPADDKDHELWVEQRERFEERLADVVFWHYGLKTAAVDPVELISHMFLHGGLMHLLGNMFFLFAVGFLVEGTLGPLTYLGAYLLTGLGAALFDFIFSPDRLTPGIGASGAVSGLMGMYAVLFWNRSIRFFYFVFVYFGFMKLPALVLLPLWLANELYQILSYPDSNINNTAHLGGLVFGGAAGLAIRRFSSGFSLEPMEKEDRDRAFGEDLQRAEILCEDLEYAKAKPLLKRLHALDPSDRRVMRLLHTCLSVDPADTAYHALSHEILRLSDQAPETNQWVADTYRDYLKRAQPSPKLNRRLIHALAGRFIAMGDRREAKRLVNALLKRKQADDRTLLLARSLSELLLRQGDAEQARVYARLADRLNRPAARPVAAPGPPAGKDGPESA